MSTPVIRYPFDPTGQDPNNLVTGDVQTMPARKIRVVGPSNGPFYTESLVITDTATNKPLTPDQFYCAEMVTAATLDTGLEVMSYIMITDPTVSSTVSLQYQAVGGDYSWSVAAIIQQINNLNLDDRPAAWPAIIGKPDAFPPSAHLHDAGDLFGFEYTVAALDRIRDAILLGDEASHDAIYKYIDLATDQINAGVAQLQATLNAHISDFSNPHKVTAAQVGAYTTAQSDANLTAARNALQTSINAVSTELTSHENNLSNPHKVTAAQVGAYTTGQTDAAITAAVNAAKLPYTPVQQGGGASQGNNKVYLGWDGSRLRAQVDSTDLGGLVAYPEFSANVNNLQNQINTKAPASNPYAYSGIGQGVSFGYVYSSGNIDLAGDIHASGTIYCNNDIWAFMSDERLKENIQTIKNPLKKIHALHGVTYNHNDLAVAMTGIDKARRYMGLLAGEVKKVAPEIVGLTSWDRGADGKSISGEDYLTIQYEKLAALLTEGIKAVDLKVDGVIRAVRRAGLGTFLPVEDVESEEVESALLPA